MLRRVMLIELDPALDAAGVAGFEQTLRTLPEHVPDLVEWRLARNLSSMRPAQRPYSHVWEVTFRDLDSLRRYQTDDFHSRRVHPMFDKTDRQCVVSSYVAAYYELT